MNSVFVLLGIIAVVWGNGCINPDRSCTASSQKFPKLPTFDSHKYVTLENHNYWVELNITDPDYRQEGNTTGHTYQYVLVYCGCENLPLPSGSPIIRVPVADIGNVIPDVYPMLGALNVQSRLTLSLYPNYIATDTVFDDIISRMNKIYFVEDFDPRDHQGDANTDVLKKVNPEVFFCGFDIARDLRGKFSNYIYWGSGDENSAVARSEWIEIMGVIVGEIDKAQAESDRARDNYEKVKNSIAANSTKPSVFMGTLYRMRDRQTHKLVKRWLIPGNESDQANLVYDAQGKYLGPAGAKDMLIEESDGYNWLRQADFWLDAEYCFTRLESFLGEFPDLANYPVVQKTNIYTPTRRAGDDLCQVNEAYETGSIYPSYLLADVVNILHPGTIPNRKLQFYSSILPLSPNTHIQLGNTSTYPVNCKYGDWQKWSDCSASCGPGYKYRYRNIDQLPKNGGSQCSSSFDAIDCEGSCKSTFNLTVLLICVGIIAFLVALTVAWYVGRRTAKNIGNNLQNMKADEKSVMIEQLAQGNYNSIA